MKKILILTLLFIFGLTTMLGSFLLPVPALAAFELIRAKGFEVIYYLDSRGVRHAFPNQITYQSWYGNDFSKVITLDKATVDNYPLGKNITIRPGTYLVKVPSRSEVYLIEQGGVLRQLQNESIAEAIYGEGWSKRVVDLPEVFFQNYLIGEMVNHDYTIPDSVLYQDSDTGRYYYRNNGILRPFASTQATLDNNFDLNFVVKGNRSYYVREKPIIARDKTVFNPTAEPLVSRRDCANQNLKAAVIFVADEEYSSAELAKLQTIKLNVASRFAYVTDGLAEIDMDYPTSILLDDGYLISQRQDGTTEIHNEVINTFYDNNADDFDFVFVWSNFKTPPENTNEIARFIPVTNKVEGIGKGLLDRANIFGSTGKLKGIIMMGDINKYYPETAAGLDQALNIVMHEILHNWAAYISFVDADGQTSTDLLRDDDYSHWSIYNSFISPLGGSGWINNGNGTFTSGLTKLQNTNLRKYSQLDLYLMGLIPQRYVQPVSYVAPQTKGEIGNNINGTVKTVTIEQIVQANGKWQCSLD